MARVACCAAPEGQEPACLLSSAPIASASTSSAAHLRQRRPRQTCAALQRQRRGWPQLLAAPAVVACLPNPGMAPRHRQQRRRRPCLASAAVAVAAASGGQTSWLLQARQLPPPLLQRQPCTCCSPPCCTGTCCSPAGLGGCGDTARANGSEPGRQMRPSDPARQQVACQAVAGCIPLGQQECFASPLLPPPLLHPPRILFGPHCRSAQLHLAAE